MYTYNGRGVVKIFSKASIGNNLLNTMVWGYKKALTRQAVLKRSDASDHATQTRARNSSTIFQRGQPNTYMIQYVEREIFSITGNARPVFHLRFGYLMRMIVTPATLDTTLCALLILIYSSQLLKFSRISRSE